jgi:hypothetical protein
MNTVIPFNITNDRLLFFDIFHKNNKVYLIQPVYSHTRLDLSTIKLTSNDTELILEKVISKIAYEPTQILIYTFQSTEPTNTITVTYNSVSREYILEHIQSSVNNVLSITTLFKNDYHLISIFYDYYLKQGVTQFYMYYNGILTDKIRDKFNLPNVTLIEWNYKYWNDESSAFTHHAQLGQIHHSIYKYGKDNNSHMIFCDLDEYMYNCDDTLKNMVIKFDSIDVFGFCNIWSNTLDNKIPNTFPLVFNIGNQYTFPTKSKCIYKLSSISTISIHGYEILKSSHNKLLNYKLFHFYNWSGKYRIESTPHRYSIKDNN